MTRYYHTTLLKSKFGLFIRTSINCSNVALSVVYELLNFILSQCTSATTLSILRIRACAQSLTGQFADKPTRGQSNRGLDNLRTSQLADSEFLKIMKLLCSICTLNVKSLTRSNIGSV